MGTMILRRLGVCAVLLASLTAATGPAAAAITIACKNAVEVGGGGLSEPSAKSHVEILWTQAVTNQYGQFWANFSKAIAKHYMCKKTKGGWHCQLTARPCAQVTRPSSSAPEARMRPAMP